MVQWLEDEKDKEMDLVSDTRLEYESVCELVDLWDSLLDRELAKEWGGELDDV